MRNKIYLLALALTAAMTLSLTSCSSNCNGEINYIPAKVDKSDNWGMVGPDGEMLFDDQFEDCPTAAVNGFFTVKEDGKVSVYKAASKKPEAVKDLQELKGAGMMSCGRIPVVREKGRIEIADESGKTVATLEPVDGKEIESCYGYYTDDRLIIVDSEGKIGAVDRSGKVVVKTEFDRMYPFNEGVAIAAKAKEGKDYEYDYCLIDTKGQKVCEFKDDMTPVGNFMRFGVIPVKNGKKYGFLNKKGEFLAMPSKVDGIEDWTGDIFVYRNENGKRGVMNFEKEDIIKAKYSKLQIVNDNRFIVKRDSKWSMIDAEEERICKFEDADEVVWLSNTFIFDVNFPIIVETDNDNFIFVDDKGEQIGKEEYDRLSIEFSNTVESDYFDIATVVNVVASKTSATGFNDVAIGEQMSKLVTGNPDNYSYTSKADIYELNERKFSVEAQASADYYIAIGDWTRDAYGWLDRYVYTFNPMSVVERITVKINLPRADYDSFREEYDSQLASKGWKYVEKEKPYAIYKSDKEVYLIIEPGYDGTSGVRLNFMSLMDYDLRRSSIVADACRNYKDSDGREYSASEFEPAAAEAVDTVAAVEEVVAVDSVAY